MRLSLAGGLAAMLVVLLPAVLAIPADKSGDKPVTQPDITLGVSTPVNITESGWLKFPIPKKIDHTPSEEGKDETKDDCSLKVTVVVDACVANTFRFGVAVQGYDEYSRNSMKATRGQKAGNMDLYDKMQLTLPCNWNGRVFVTGSPENVKKGKKGAELWRGVRLMTSKESHYMWPEKTPIDDETGEKRDKGQDIRQAFFNKTPTKFKKSYLTDAGGYEKTGIMSDELHETAQISWCK